MSEPVMSKEGAIDGRWQRLMKKCRDDDDDDERRRETFSSFKF